MGGSLATTPHWTAYVAALGPLIIAALVVYIAWQQWLTAKDRLKFDLFEKSFPAYQHLYNLVQEICQNGRATNDDYVRFRVETRDIKWLFSAIVSKYVYNELLPAVKRLSIIRTQIENPDPDQDTSALVRNEVELASWFDDQLNVIEKKVSSDLKLRQHGTW
jgi:hypothetical protein